MIVTTYGVRTDRLKQSVPEPEPTSKGAARARTENDRRTEV